jgi:hypothetical protein
MYGLTRGTTTLIGAGLAGLLSWVATQISVSSTGRYWGVIGLFVAAGLVMALSQLLGGWTKWGWPRVSGSVFLVAFLPVLVCTGWVILAEQPGHNWFQRHINSWSGSIGIDGLVHDLERTIIVLAFGLGLVFGLVFDTTGPRTEPILRRRRMPIPTTAVPTPSAAPEAPAEPAADAEQAPAAREAETRISPQPKPPPDETTRDPKPG